MPHCPVRFSSFPRLCIAAVSSVLLTLYAHATLLRPISEDDQIREAETIFRGKVERIDVARKVMGNRLAVVSTVSFLPLTIYKGTPASPIALEFLGGKIDGKTMRVDGMPQFSVGQEYILFVSATANRACPVVGWSEGSLKVDRGTNPAGQVAVSTEVSGRTERSMLARIATLPAGVSDLPSYETRLRARIGALKSLP